MDWPRVRAVWKRVISLAWPVMAEQTFRTLMRTVDIVVTATFNPASVVAIGLADLYARLPLRIGLGLGGGTIALSSQDSGAAADANRDEAITQGILLGALLGVPFVLLGFFLSEPAIRVFGAGQDVENLGRVVALGSTYLAIIFATAPARHVALIAARALQGTGDTRTPMYVNVVANGLNILGSLAFGLGFAPLGIPRLKIVGVGLATAAANVFTASMLCLAIWTDWSEASFALPEDWIIAKQLVVVSAPKIAEGFASTAAEFPFNAILLGFGQPVNAGFQIGRRMYQQVTGPLSRGYNVAASVVVGQRLGEGDAGGARFEGWAVAGLGLLTVGSVGVGLVFAADTFVSLFTGNPDTVDYAVAFAQVYGICGAALVVFSVLSGGLQGASETRIPLVARTSGVFGLQLGLTFLLGVVLGWGALGAYVGIGATYVWMALVVAAGFHFTDWADRAAEMMEERGSDVSVYG
ncbi:MATE family efflux transporter [Halolamina rubra]|uniref:MATE family efflux transporter n=1 Tax=Halolamina rubra TaxID=1380430 RepID=UPI000679E388|nr:MATE family efflux transporter [Halolamina rubra]